MHKGHRQHNICSQTRAGRSSSHGWIGSPWLVQIRWVQQRLSAYHPQCLIKDISSFTCFCCSSPISSYFLFLPSSLFLMYLPGILSLMLICRLYHMGWVLYCPHSRLQTWAKWWALSWQSPGVSCPWGRALGCNRWLRQTSREFESVQEQVQGCLCMPWAPSHEDPWCLWRLLAQELMLCSVVSEVVDAKINPWSSICWRWQAAAKLLPNRCKYTCVTTILRASHECSKGRLFVASFLATIHPLTRRRSLSMSMRLLWTFGVACSSSNITGRLVAWFCSSWCDPDSSCKIFCAKLVYFSFHTFCQPFVRLVSCTFQAVDQVTFFNFLCELQRMMPWLTAAFLCSDFPNIMSFALHAFIANCL